MSDEVPDFFEDVFDVLLSTSTFDRSRIRSLRDRVRALEKENAELRARLAGRSIKKHAADPPTPTDRWAPPPERTGGADPWATPAVAPTVSTARFACGACNELFLDAELVRIDDRFRCKACHEADRPLPPVKRGSYR